MGTHHLGPREMTSLAAFVFLCLLSSLREVHTSICLTESSTKQCFTPTENLLAIKQDLELNGFALIPGHTMKSLMKNFGAKLEDMDLIESAHIHERLPQDLQPVMKHRRNAFHRVLIDQVNNELSTADTHACSQFRKREIASYKEEGSRIDYRRHGTRCYAIVSDSYSRSSLPMAMATMNMMLLPKVHHPQENINTGHNVTIDDQVLIRITRDSSQDDSYSPTPEGIHQDNTELSSITLIGRYNVTQGGETRIWTLEAPTGNYDEDDFKSGSMDHNLLLNKALTDPWETVIFNDRKVKHEARAFSGGQQSARDVIVNFMRKPLSDGTDVKLRLEGFVPI